MAKLEDITKVLSFIIAIFSIIGNSLVCHIIIQTKSMKTVMNYLLLNLAILDAVTGFLAILNVIIDGRSEMLGTANFLEQAYNKSTVAGEVLCKLQVSFWLGSAVTPMLLTTMAYERYMAVVHPFRRRAGTGGLTKARLKWILAVCWLSGLVFLTCDFMTVTYTQGACDLASLEWFDIKIYTVFLACIQFVIPSIIIFILYFRVINVLRTREALGVQEEGQRARNRARRKVVFIIITVTVIFYIFSGIPHALYFLYELFDVGFWASSEKFSVLLFTVNSISNPLIYFSFMKTFRRRLLKLICKSGKENPQGNIIIINKFSLKRENDASNYGSKHLDNRFENEPKLLRISRSASSVL